MRREPETRRSRLRHSPSIASSRQRSAAADQLREPVDAQTEGLRSRLREQRERGDERAQEHRQRVAELRGRGDELTAA